MDPTMRQLEVFLAVAKAGSFRRAADGLHLSQPALSQHVGELERGLGARFFDRRGRTVTLTEAGRILEDHALRLFATLAGAREAIAELDGVGRGTLVVGASTTPGIYLMPALMGEFERAYPGISVDLRIANSRVIEEQIRANELDLGVVGAARAPCGREMPCGHPTRRARVDRAARPIPGPDDAELDPSRLAQERLLMREEGSATRHVTERALQRASLGIGRTLELGHTEAIKQAVMAGLGVAFVSIYAGARRTGDRTAEACTPSGTADSAPLPRDPQRGPNSDGSRASLHRRPRALSAGAPSMANERSAEAVPPACTSEPAR